ncbi:MAG: AI-2E family transporter [Verrucomicrobiales bacterium]|nr:AI-2E family transporter [Verrucomicrobiales bacterium]
MANGLGLRHHHRENGGLKVLLTLACIVIVIAGLRLGAELFVPVVLGLFLAILSLPMLNWLIRLRLPRPLAIFFTVGFDLAFLSGLVFLATSVIPEFQARRADYAKALQERAANATATIDAQLEKFSGFVDKFGVDPNGEPEDTVPGNKVPTLSQWFNENWDSGIIIEWIGQTELVGRVTSLASKAVFALIIMIFLLSESHRFSQKLREVIRVRGPDLRRFQNSSRDIQKYLGIKTAISAVTGLLAWLSCTVIGVDFPILWGLVAFLFNFVPAIGSIVAAFPPVILALILQGFWPAVAVMICYLAINMALGNFVEPVLMGERFGIATVVVILSVVFWGFVWGPVGMFLAVPLTMMVKVMLDNSPDLRWISVLISKARPDGLPPRRRGVRLGGATKTPAAPTTPMGGEQAPVGK